jgi:hypothetical protein
MKNHPKDRHVLAAAIACRADYLVTFNLKDFAPVPADAHGVAVIGPSTFLKELAALEIAPWSTNGSQSKPRQLELASTIFWIDLEHRCRHSFPTCERLERVRSGIEHFRRPRPAYRFQAAA